MGAESLSTRVIRFIETLPSPDDPTKKVVLDPFQKDFIINTYEPTYVKSTGEVARAIRQALMTIARKNGKTTLIACLVITHLIGPLSAYNQQIISAAFDREQAGIIYRTCKAIIDADVQLSAFMKCTDSSKKVFCALNSSYYQSISSEARSKHGLNPAVIIFDELAQMGANRELYDTLCTSQGAQKEPLFIVISTQAPSDDAVLSQLVDYGRAVMTGEINDPHFYLMEFSAPPDEELKLQGLTIWHEEVWHLANPALGTFRSIDEMRDFASKAKNSPSMEATFRSLYLNQRINTATTFVVQSTWLKGARHIDLSELKGRPMYIGVDLSTRNDLTAIASVIDINDTGAFYGHAKAFLPADSSKELARLARAPYLDWIARGYMEETPGSSIEYGFVAQYIVDLCRDFDVRKIAFDRWRFEVLKAEILRIDENFDTELLIPFGQGYRDMSPAIDDLESKLLNGKLLHGNNPLLRWAFTNAVLEKDPAGNRKLSKKASYGKIDPAVALTMALGAVSKDNVAPFNIGALIA